MGRRKILQHKIFAELNISVKNAQKSLALKESKFLTNMPLLSMANPESEYFVASI